MKGFNNALAERALPWSHRIKTGLLCSIGLSAAIAAAAPAAAQDAAPPASPPAEAAEAKDIGDIVVTARRRSESLQAVPVSVTVATPLILKEQKIVQAQDLQNLAPSLSVVSSSVSQQQSGSFTIRGQGQSFGGSLPSVITYFSEVPLESQGGAAFALYDIDSVQVLRGPQGTLFGRNTNGGAVLITPTAPGRDLTGYASLSYGNLDYKELRAAVNIPVTDKLFLRAATNIIRRDDYTKNLLGHGFGNWHSDAFRISVRWEPTDNFRNDLVYNRLNAKEHGSAFVLVGLRPGSRASTFGNMMAEFQAQQARGARVVSNSQDALGASRKIDLLTNTSTLDIGEAKVKAIFAYERVKVCYGSDLDGVDTRQSFSSCYPSVISRAAGIDPYNDIDLRQLTGELQISGTALDGRLDYQAGAFYLEGKTPGGLDTFRVNRVTFAQASATALQTALTINQFRDTSKAIFTQETFRFGNNNQLSITAGGRYTWDTRRASFGRLTAPYPTTATMAPALSAYTCTLPGIGVSSATPQTSCYRRLEGKYSDYGYNFSVDWKPADGFLVYVTTRRGFKDGGFNTVIASANNPEYQPERITDYEAGLKSSFDVGPARLRFNIDAFTSKYEGPQRFVSGGFPVTSVIINAGNARVKGIELETNLRLGEFSVSTHYSHLIGNYKQFIDGGVDVSDSKFIGLPKHSGGATLRWEHPLPGDVGTLIASTTVYATSRMPYIANNFANYEAFIDNYATLSGRIEWRDVMGKKIDLALWGKNLTDKLYVQGGAAQGATSGITSYLYAEPRTYGLEATFRF